MGIGSTTGPAVVMHPDVPDVLASVDGLTSELRVESGGTCGKGHKEYVRTATGGPYVRCRMKLG